MKLEEIDKLLENKTKKDLIEYVLDNIELTVMEENSIDDWDIEELKYFINIKLLNCDDFNKYMVRTMFLDNEQLDIMDFIREQRINLKKGLIAPASMSVLGLNASAIMLSNLVGVHTFLLGAVSLSLFGFSVAYLDIYFKEKKELKNLQLQYDTPKYNIKNFLNELEEKKYEKEKGYISFAIKCNDKNLEILNYIKKLEEEFNIKFIENKVVLSSLLNLVDEKSKDIETQLIYTKRLLLKIFQYVGFNERNEVTLYDIAYVVNEGNKVDINFDLIEFSEENTEIYTKKLKR